MKNSLIKGLMVFLTMLGTTLAYSQDVSGTVSDASGPLPGASVLVKGTTKGAQTDAAGKFTIKDAGANAVLTISYIGLKTQEVNVAGRSTVKVTLQDGATELGQVVVIGYGSVKKKDATGAVDVLNSKNIDNVAATSPAEILRGKVAGVQVTTSSGEPGAATAIRVRGNTSIRSGNGPLIVIDGVPLEGGNVSAAGPNVGLGASSARNPLNFINQNDIESMSVLKDASSTAIYGSRGANGVIVITTKKGKSKEPQLTYGASYQFSSLATKFDVLSADKFASLITDPTDDFKSRSYNWKDAILRSGSTMNHELSFSSGTDKSSTRVSFSATNSDGIVKNTGLDKYTASVYNSNDFLDGKLKIESRINYANLKDESTLISNNTGYIGNVIAAALYWNPTRPIYNDNGKYNVVSTDFLNPVELLDAYKDNTNTNKLIGSIAATLKINKNLKYQFLLGVENSTSTRKTQVSPTIRINDVAVIEITNDDGSKNKYYGQAIIQNDERFNKSFEHNLTFNKDLSDNFNLDAILGYSYYDYTFNGNFVSAKGFSPNQTNLIDNIEGNVGKQGSVVTSSYRGRSEMQSVFARARMSLYKKLNFDLTVRRDGSSKPGKNKKYGNFPSTGIAYKLVENKEGLLNDLKLRATAGITGNVEFPANSAVGKAYYDKLSSNSANSENTELAWEKTTSYGVGADFTLLKSKLSGSVDYYIKNTSDLISAYPAEVSQPGPAVSKYFNIPGKLVNKGTELSLTYKAIDREDFTWDVSANVALLKNKIEGIGANRYNTGELNGQGLSDAYSQVIADGYPLYSYYTYEFVGFDSNGNSLYKDDAGATVLGGNATKRILDKQPLPKMTLGFSTAVTYKNWDASTSFYGSFGHYIYNNTSNAYFYKGALGFRNVTESVANSKQNASDPNTPSTYFLEKGDFLRMGNLTLGYTVKGDVLERMKVKSARFYVNGSNLLLFTNYSGFDPEVDTDKSMGGVPSAGIDYLAYPKSKSFALGLNITF